MDDEGADREFWVAIFNLPQVDSLRSLRSAQLGRLVAFQVQLADFRGDSAPPRRRCGTSFMLQPVLQIALQPAEVVVQAT